MTFDTLKPAGRLDPVVKRFLDPDYSSRDHNDYITALTEALEKWNNPAFSSVKKDSKYSTEACRRAATMYDSLKTWIQQQEIVCADQRLMEHFAKQPMNEALYETTNPLLLILRKQWVDCHEPKRNYK